MARRFILFLTMLFVLMEGCKESAAPTSPGNELLQNPFIKPKVVSTYPENYSKGPYDDPRVIIEFNKSMDVSSIKEALMSPLYMGDVIADTHYVYATLEGNSFYLYILKNLKGEGLYPYSVGHTYQLEISTTAKDVNGNHLASPFILYFTPEPNFRVTLRERISDGIIISGWEVQFNSPIDSSILNYISVYPSNVGIWHFDPNDKSFISYFFTKFNFDQTYTLSIRKEAHDIYGNQLTSYVTTSEYVPPFQIRGVFPPDGSTDISVDLGIDIAFTGVLDTASVRKSFSISPSVAGSVWVNWDQMGFTPSDELDVQTKYTVTIGNSLQAQNGTHLQTTQSFSFTTIPFEVKSIFDEIIFTNINPADSGRVPRDIFLNIGFTAKIDTNIVQSAFTIDPPVKGKFEFSQDNYPIDDMKEFRFYPDSLLASNTKYTVTISQAMRSNKGVSLSAPYVQSFLTRF